MNLFPIGTVVEVNDKKLCIVGYTSMQKEDEVQCGYYAVSYPIGYINVERMFFIPASLSMRVIKLGFQTEASEKVLELLGIYFDSAKMIAPEKISLVIDAYKKALNKLKKEEE